LAKEAKNNLFQSGLAFEVIDGRLKHYFGTPLDGKAEDAGADSRERNAL